MGKKKHRKRAERAVAYSVIVGAIDTILEGERTDDIRLVDDGLMDLKEAFGTLKDIENGILKGEMQ